MTPEIETRRTTGAPDQVSVVTENYAVIICDGCGVVWESVACAAYEIPHVSRAHIVRVHPVC